MRECGWCGRNIVNKNRHARYCSSKCRVYAHRSPVPAELIQRDRWVRYATNKRPLTTMGQAASSTNPSTWASYADAKASTAGVGLGFVLGDGIGCIDLDNCITDGEITPEAANFISDYPQHHIEISPSGNGLHIWGTADEAAGSVKTIDGVSVERYSQGRYITVTGNIYQRGRLLPL